MRDTSWISSRWVHQGASTGILPDDVIDPATGAKIRQTSSVVGQFSSKLGSDFVLLPSNHGPHLTSTEDPIVSTSAVYLAVSHDLGGRAFPLEPLPGRIGRWKKTN